MKTDLYYSIEFDEYVKIQKRMPKTCQVVIYGGGRELIERRLTKPQLAAYLRACKFKPVRTKEQG